MESTNISQAADVTGISRRTIQRWIGRGEIEKNEKGMISIRDVERRARRTNPKGGRQTAFQNVEFCSPPGAKRFTQFVFLVGLKYKNSGRVDEFNELLADVVGKLRIL